MDEPDEKFDRNAAADWMCERANFFADKLEKLAGEGTAREGYRRILLNQALAMKLAAEDLRAGRPARPGPIDGLEAFVKPGDDK